MLSATSWQVQAGLSLTLSASPSWALYLPCPLVPLLHPYQFKCCAFSKATSSRKPFLIVPTPSAALGVKGSDKPTDSLLF